MTAIKDEKAIEINRNFAILGKDVYNKFFEEGILVADFQRYITRRIYDIKKVNELVRKE